MGEGSSYVGEDLFVGMGSYVGLRRRGNIVVTCL